MVDNRDWLSRQIGIDAVNKFLDEYNKPSPGDDYAAIKMSGSPNRFMFIKPDGTPVDGKRYGEVSPYHNGKANVAYGDLGFPNYGYIDSEGKFYKSRGDGYYSDRKVVYDKGDMYHFVDRDGNKVGGDYYNANRDLDCYTMGIPLDYFDGYAVAQKESHGRTMLIDVDGNEIEQEKGDKVVKWGNMGYGYYVAGEMDKIQGVKLRDANSGITIDRFQHTSSWTYGILEHIKKFIVSHSGKAMPFIGYDSHEVGKEDGVLFFGNYWFLGPSNLKVTKEQDGYHSTCEFGEFITKIPPIKAIDDNYLLCAHNNGVYVYDKKSNSYGKSCTRKDVEEQIRIRQAKVGYEKMANDIRALINYRKLHPGDDVKIAVGKNSLMCSPICDSKEGLYHELQPIFLKFPAILQFIDYINWDYSKYYVMYNGKRISVGEAFEDLRSKTKGEVNIEDVFQEQSSEAKLH